MNAISSTVLYAYMCTIFKFRHHYPAMRSCANSSVPQTGAAPAMMVKASGVDMRPGEAGSRLAGLHLRQGEASRTTFRGKKKNLQGKKKHPQGKKTHLLARINTLRIRNNAPRARKNTFRARTKSPSRAKKQTAGRARKNTQGKKKHP